MLVNRLLDGSRGSRHSFSLTETYVGKEASGLMEVGHISGLIGDLRDDTRYIIRFEKCSEEKVNELGSAAVEYGPRLMDY